MLAALATSVFCASAQVLTFDQAKQRADQGDAYAQAVVALHYQLGWGVPAFDEAAAQYAVASAKAGHPLGMFRLGSLLRGGDGLTKDEQQGLALQAASFDGLNRMTGDPYAATSLGVMVFQGKAVWQNVPQDRRRQQAALLYKKAADLGFAPAQFNYAMALNDGHGVAKDSAARDNYLSKAIAASYPPALSFRTENNTAGNSGFSAIGKTVTIPLLPSAIVNARLNPTTQIYERPGEPGKTERWHRLDAEANPRGVEINLRMNYSGLPLGYQGNSGGIDSEAVYDSWSRQSMWRSGQYEIKSEDETGIVVGPVLPLEMRNLASITEYPACFEIEIKNNGKTPLSVESLLLDVKSAIPENKIIPHLIVDNSGEAVFHNFGWNEVRQWKALLDLHEFTWTPPGPEIKDRLNIENIAEGKRFDITQFVTIPQNKDKYYKDAGFYDYKPHYLAEINCVDKDGATATHNSVFGTLGYQDVFYHSVYSPDLELPVGKGDYSVVYAINATMEPNDSVRYSFTLGANRSGRFDILPKIVFGDGDVLQLKPLITHLERAREAPSHPPAKALHTDNGGDGANYLDYQLSMLQSIPSDSPLEFNGHGTPDWLRIFMAFLSPLVYGDEFRAASSEPEARASVDSLLGRALGDAKFPRRVYPKIQSAVACKVLPPARGQEIGRIETDNKSFRLILCSSSPRVSDGTSEDAYGRDCGGEGPTVSDGILEVVDTLSGQPLAQLPYAYKPTGAELSVSLVSSKQGDWFAWTCGEKPYKKLYIAFPKQADSVFCLPLVDESNIDDIALSQSGSSLLISSDESMRQLDLSSPLASLLSDCLRAENIEAYINSDIDELGRVRLWLPTDNSRAAPMLPSSRAVFALPPLGGGRGDVGLVWFDPARILVGDKVWDIAASRVHPPTATDLQRIKRVDQASKFATWEDASMAAKSDHDSLYAPVQRGPVSVQFPLKETNRAPFFAKLSGAMGWTGPLDTAKFFEINPGNYGRAHSHRNTLATCFSLSPDDSKIAFINADGTALYIADLAQQKEILRIVQSAQDPRIISSVAEGGYYLSGNGLADRVVFSDGNRAFAVSQFEAKYNRPDIVLERLGADESLIKEARRLRERLLRRSDLKSFEGAGLIDIPVVIVKTKVPEKTGDKSLTLDFEASNSTGPLKELRVFNNGALVQTLQLNGKDGQPSRESAGEVKVDLASGENRLQFMAVSEEGVTSAFAEKRLVCTAEPDSRRCFIAAVGVSEYNDPRFNLKFAAKDAEDMSKALAAKAQHRGYQPEVMVVRNAEVDGGLVTKLREFLSKAGIDDEVVLFFAGHGLLDKDLEYHFARHDTDFDANENMGITFEELESLVDGIQPLKRTVLFDTCHSGEVEEEDKPQLLAMVGVGDLSAAAVADAGVQVRGVATRGMKVKELEPKLRHTDFIELESLFPDSRRAKGANILTSSSGSEFSMESDAWQNGLFTFAFLSALKDEKTDANGDKVVSFSEAAAAVQDKVKTLSGGQQRPITRGVNREAEVALASFGPPVAAIPTKEKTSGWWPF